MYNQDISMATIPNNNPNNDNPIEPNKKRYILPDPNNEQKPSSNPRPQSPVTGGNHTLSPADLKSKFAKPEVAAPAPKEIPITLNSSPEPEAKNFRYETKKEEFSIPTPAPSPAPIVEPKFEAPKISPVAPAPIAAPIIKEAVNPLPPEIENAVNVAVSESKETANPLQDNVTPKVEIANEFKKEDKYSLPGTDTDQGFQTKSQEVAAELTAKFAPKVEAKVEVKSEPVAEVKPEPKVEPKIEAPAPVAEAPKVEAPKVEIPKIVAAAAPVVIANVNPLPPEIQSAAEESVKENKEATNVLEDAVTKPEEVTNKYEKESKFKLPGTDSEDGYQTNSEKIRDEIASKFAPKAEVKVETPVAPIVAPVVVAAAPIVVATVNPLPPEIQAAVDATDVENKESANVLEDAITKPEEVANKYEKETKFKLPGTDTDSDNLTQSEKIRDEIASKFAPKAEPKIDVPAAVVLPAPIITATVSPLPPEIQSSVDVTDVEENSQDSLKDGIATKEAPVNTYEKNTKYVLPGTEAESSVTTPQEDLAAKFRPKQTLNDATAQPIQGTVTVDNNQADESGEVKTAAEYIDELEATKPTPKYTLPPKSVQGTAVEQAGAVAAGAAGAVSGAAGAASNASPIGPRINRPQEGSQSSDPNRYVSPAGTTSTSTSTGGGTTTTTNVKTTKSEERSNTTLTFDVSTTKQRLVKGKSKGTAQGTVVAGAATGAVVAGAAVGAVGAVGAGVGAIAAIGTEGVEDQDSGIFDGVKADGTAIGTVEGTKQGTNFINDEANVGPKYQPTPISEFGQRQGTYDAEGNFTETPKAATDGSGEPKPKSKTSSAQAEGGIPALANTGGTSQSGEGFADQGAYDADGNLKQNIVSSDALAIVNNKPKVVLDESGQPIAAPTLQEREQAAISNAPGAIPTGAANPVNGGSANPQPLPQAPVDAPTAGEESQSGELNKGKKESLADKIVAAIVSVYVKQTLVLLSVILLTLFMILGIAFGAAYFVLAGVCSNGALLNATAALGLAGNSGADTLYKTCEAFTAFTGIGCSSTVDVFAGNGECIADYLDAKGDTVSLTGVKGAVDAKKAVIKQILASGKKYAKGNPVAVQMMVAIYGVDSTAQGIATKAADCLGALRLCGNNYALYTKDLDVKDEGAFLLSMDLQVQAFMKHYKAVYDAVDEQSDCAKAHFNDKGWPIFQNLKIKNSEYKTLYGIINQGPKQCPDEANATQIKYVDYINAAIKNMEATNCTAFKGKIASNSIDMTPYFAVAQSISSIGSYIGNGLNKFNLSITAQAETKGYASQAERAKVLTLIESNKLLIGGGAVPAEIKADIKGVKLNINRIYGDNKPNLLPPYPMHTNAANYLIEMADLVKGLTISAMGNNSHRDSTGPSPVTGRHNKDPLQAIDFSDVGGVKITNSISESAIKPFIDASAKTNRVEIYLTFAGNKYQSGNVQRFQKINPGLKIGGEGLSDHAHIQFKLGAATGTGGLTPSSECPKTLSSAKPPDTRKTTETRLNKKSLNDDQWKKEVEIFGAETDFGDASQKGIDAQTKSGDTNTKTQMFKNDAATNKIYELALSAGYQYRNVGIVGSGGNDLDGTSPISMKRDVRRDFESLKKAMSLDGIKFVQGNSFESPAETAKLLQAAILANCKCTAADIATGKVDTKIQEVFKTNNVPRMTLRGTGQMIEIKDGANQDPKKFKDSLTYKYFTEDNELNLRRFGFTFAYPTGTTKPEPLTFDNYIIWLGRDEWDEKNQPPQ